MSLIDEIKKALTATAEPLSVRQLADACPSANDTTLVAGACLKLVNAGEIVRTGDPGKYRYGIAMATSGAADATTIFRALALKEPKPGVGKNPGSREAVPTPAAGPAVAVCEGTTTSKPTSERRGNGPVPTKASTGDEAPMRCAMHDDGALSIWDGADIDLDLTPKQTESLGDFMALTSGLWSSRI